MIKFHLVRWRNFLSTGNAWTEIRLDQHKTTLISGTNGAGKSTLLDAIAYVLYKKPFRNINIPNLVNTVNQKDCLVEIEFSIGLRTYRVRRGIKPAVFEVFSDNELIPQSANVYDYQENLEKNILRMNYKTFCQIVILGSAGYTPFMLLPAQSRRDIIENLLDIDVFSRMSTVLKLEQKQNDELIAKIQQKEKIIESKVALMEKHIKELETNNESQVNDIQDNITTLQRSLDEIETKEQHKREELAAFERELGGTPIETIRSNLTKLQEAQRQYTKREKKLLETDPTRDIQNCPTCLQSITSEARQKIDDRKHEILSKITEGSEKISRKIQTYSDELDNALLFQEQVNEKNVALAKLGNERVRVKDSIRTLQKQIEGLQRAKKEIDTTDLEKHKTALERLAARKDIALEEDDLLSLAATLLKDGGIKTMIVRQYIPVMNKLINKYLEQMDFYCLFEIDETFKETMKAVYKDEMVYTSLSQGERMRVDIALLFTWREIAKMRNAALTNILILDEIVDSSLDGAGTEEFLKIIQTLSQSANIFIISHKAEQIVDKFEHSIRFEKRSNFSEIAKEA